MDNQFSAMYMAYIQSLEWKAKSERRKAIDGNKCVLCGKSHNLQVHHITYDRLGREDVENDLVTLCDQCHVFVHDNKSTVKGGIIKGALVCKIDETDGKLEGFFKARGIVNMAHEAAELLRAELKVLYIPVTDGGALTVPLSSRFYSEKDAKKMCDYLGEDFGKMVIGAAQIYHAAIKGGGYVEDNL